MLFFKTRFDLSKYGEEFNGCYVDLRLLDKGQLFKFTRENEKLAKESGNIEDDKLVDTAITIYENMYKWVADSFLGGEVMDEGVKRPMKKEDVEMFPTQIIQEMIKSIQGGLGKKA